MRLVFFAHPAFLDSQSMMRFTDLLSVGMHKRGHQTEVWSPKAVFFNLPLPGFFKKWMGYIDQFIVFRIAVLKRLKNCPDDTIFVFTDQAIGPWVPWIKGRPHAIHCHDFLAQRSALGQIKQNPTKWFGRQYQAYIRRGYQQGRNFISVSKKTQQDLHQFLLKKPLISEVVYNGLNQSFVPGNANEARRILSEKVGIDLSAGYISHIGGNQWYKNRLGVVEIYDEFKTQTGSQLPLLMIGQKPTAELLDIKNKSNFGFDIHYLEDIDDQILRISYIGASVFMFPSLAEGFGWPIVEAMASGCLVITTNEAPMSEVAADAAFLIPVKPIDEDDTKAWTKLGAKAINDIIELSLPQREVAVKKGLTNSKRFNADVALDSIENIYKAVLLHANV